MGQKTIEQAVEDWVHVQVRTSDVERLPPLTELSKRFGLSVRRLSVLFHRLQDEGVVDIARRKGISIRRWPDTLPLTNTTTGSSADRIYELIKTRIVHGKYPSGMNLSKLSAAAKEHSVGQATVLRAYGRLVREGIVSRVGRRYQVGASLDSRAYEPGSDKYIIIVQCRPQAFPNLLKNSWTRDFASSFLREMSQRGIQPLPVLVSTESGPEMHSGIPVGREGIAEIIHEQGENCIGMLVIGIAWDYEHVAREPFDEFLRWLCSFGRPVVWFDEMDAGGYYQNEHGVRESLKKAFRKDSVRRWFVRCRFDERKAAELALSVIRDRGHKTVGLLALSSPGPEYWSWVDQRCKYIRETADRAFGAIDLRTIRADCDDTVTLDQLHRCLSEMGAPVPREFERYRERNAVFGDVPHAIRNFIELSLIRETLQNSSIDCFIAPNDQMARRIRAWGDSTGCKAARSKPLLSFDDRLEILYPYRVSSVNFGFDVLGTTAFRIITGTGPAGPGRSRTISAVPRINHLHTV